MEQTFREYYVAGPFGGGFFMAEHAKLARQYLRAEVRRMHGIDLSLRSFHAAPTCQHHCPFA